MTGALHAVPSQAQSGQPPAVTVSEPLQRELIEWQEFTGQFAAVDYVDVRARVSGYLEEIHFDDGQMVSEGDLLFVIDPRPFQADLNAAQAELAEAQARLDLAQQQLERAQELLSNNNIAQATFDERSEEVSVASASVDLANARVATAQLNLDFTNVEAAVGGRISQREVSVGNLVLGGATGSATLLTNIVSLDPIYFEFDMSESYYLAYQRAISQGSLQAHRDGGVQVTGRLFDETDWPLQGQLDFVDNRIDRTSGTIRMRAVYPNPDGLITPGQFGILRLPASPQYNALLLPDDAILSDQDQRIVLIVNDQNIVEARVVRPGPREYGLRIIRDGLEPTDNVIINGMIRARPGSPVTPQQGQITAADTP
ncbi:MAG: efflux RND transporter periplasmic adaptor subunit [Pseudomonadota bacterium]